MEKILKQVYTPLIINNKKSEKIRKIPIKYVLLVKNFKEIEKKLIKYEEKFIFLFKIWKTLKEI